MENYKRTYNNNGRKHIIISGLKERKAEGNYITMHAMTTLGRLVLPLVIVFFFKNIGFNHYIHI